MINMGLSAKQEKDDRFQQIKKEVVEMIKIQAPSLEMKVMLSLSLSACASLDPLVCIISFLLF
jgi:hypothetical protein